jgi:hypothetical protein
MKSVFLLIFLALATISATAFTPYAQITESDLSGDEEITQGNYTISDGIDYATRVLADPWDMSEFYDISQGLNLSNFPDQHLMNIQVSGGIFSASTVGTYSEFFPLFPGYPPGTRSGKIGSLYPINSSTFACFFMAMKSTWNSDVSNYFLVGWGPNNDTNNPWGFAISSYITNDQWRLHQFNLNKPPQGVINSPWSSQQFWQYLRITPSKNIDTQFSIDWIRLTNCQPVNVNLTGLPQDAYSIWLGTGSPERQILVVNSFPHPNGSYTWDVQGIPAGNYNYYVKDSTGNPVQQGQLNINGSPIVTFTSPSPYSGQDYANGQGNPWDMEPSDITLINCATYGFSNGILSLDTQSRACAGPGANEADPKIYLNSIDHGNLSSYRYLSFSSRTDGAWSDPAKGMIVRLIWRLDRPGEDCYYISRAVALDVGWQTYTVDLYDPLNGMPEEFTPGNCPAVSWRDQGSVGPVVGFRLDPNENITGSVMHQEFDWLRLTKVEQVTQGKPVKIRVLLNKPPSEVSLNFFYTTVLSLPTQNLASTYSMTSINSPFLIYLPFVFKTDPNYDPFVEQIPADVTYLWNTTGVTPGEYYICAQAEDGYNQATYCSQAPVKINP